MPENMQWEYRVLTIGSAFGTKDEQIEATLNEWALEGWEPTHVYTPSQSGKVTIIARRPQRASTRRQYSWPSE